jgi:diacylglycerol kinase (ATP)
MPFKRVKVIANPAAGQEVPLLNILNRVFQKYEVRWKLAVTKGVGDGERMARKALQKTKNPYDLVIVYGGDGTVMDVVNGMAGGSLPMAIIPGGTGNAVAAELNIPIDPMQALEQICAGEGELHGYDVGRVGERYFMLRCDTGLSTEVMLQTDRESKERYGVIAYFMTLARSLVEPRRYDYTLIVDGKTYQHTGAACVIANIGSVGTLRLTLGPSVKPDDGLLDVFVMTTDLRSMLSTLGSIVDLTSLEDVFYHYQGKEITVQTHNPQLVNCDAEPSTYTPVTATLLPQGIQIFTPRPEANF